MGEKKNINNKTVVTHHINNTPKHVNPCQQMPNEFYHHHPMVSVEYQHSAQDHGCAKRFLVLGTSWLNK